MSTEAGHQSASSASPSPVLVGLVHAGSGAEFLARVGAKLEQVGLRSQVIAIASLDPSLGLSDIDRVALYVSSGSLDWVDGVQRALERRRQEDPEFGVYAAVADDVSLGSVEGVIDEVVRVPKGNSVDRAVDLLSLLLETPVDRERPSIDEAVLGIFDTATPRSARWLVNELVGADLPDVPPDPPRDELKSNARDLERRRGRNWLRSVQLLFDPVSTSIIDARLAIIGLGILQPQVGKLFRRTGWSDALDASVDGHDSLLSPYGRLLERVERSPSVETVSDNPSERDDLGRATYGESLGVRIRTIRSENLGRAFSVLLNGPWGSGKTTLLGMIRRELEQPEADPTTRAEPWLVVRFNAWEHQHSRPPWWWLMAEIHATAAEADLPIASGFRLLWWRHSLAILMFGCGLAILLGLGLLWGLAQAVPAVAVGLAALPTLPILEVDLTKLDGLLKVTGGALTLGSAAFVVARSMRSRRLLGSANGAELFVRNAGAPLRALTNRFRQLIEAIGRPVVVFVDDIDRCSAPYVVEFLEGIQTLFSNVQVAFVIAGDRRWIEASYATEYDDFAGASRFHGRSLGTFFLEKVFWLTANVPQISDDVRDAYWSIVLGAEPVRLQAAMAEAEAAARINLSSARTEPDIRRMIAEQADPLQTLAYKNAAIHRLASKRLELETEHQLRPFAPLLEANPRAMKQYVNRYAVDRDANLLTQLNVDVSDEGAEKLALWTILQMRWPELIDALQEDPTRIGRLVKKTPGIDASTPAAALFANPDVQRVIYGEAEGVTAVLSERDIARFLGVAWVANQAPRPAGSRPVRGAARPRNGTAVTAPA